MYSRAPAAFTRHLRALGARYAANSKTHRWSASLRFEPGAGRSNSSTKASAIRQRGSQVRTLVPRHFHPSEPSPGAVVLQTLVQWTTHGGSRSPRSAAAANARTQESFGERNRQLRKALKGGDFVRAQQMLQALLDPWDHEQDAHPVDTESYDQLLYEWSQHCGRRAQVDLTPMLQLVEAMVMWKRVNTRSFNTALVACQRRRALDAGERVLELIKQSGRQPTAFAYTTLLSCCGQLARKHKGRQDHFVGIAERFFSELVDSEADVTIEAVNAMVFVYRAGRGRSAAAVELVERTLREWHLTPDSSTISTLITCLLADKNPLEATRWLEYALKHRVFVDTAIVRSVLDECRRGAYWDKIESLQVQLQVRGVAHKDHELKRVFKHSKVRDADTTVASMLHAPVRPNQSDSKKNRKKEANAILKDVIKRIRSGERVERTQEQWARLFEDGSIDELDKLMAELVNSYSLIDSKEIPRHWWNERYLRALGSAGQWWRMVSVVDEMLATNSKAVTVECFNAAMRGCTHAGRLYEALRVKERMEPTRVSPNRHSYDSLLQCCGLIGAVEAAVDLFHEMVRARIQPTTPDLTAVLKAFAMAVQRLLEASRDTSAELDVPGSELNKFAMHALRFYEDITSKYPHLEITEGVVLQLFRSFLGAAEMIDTFDVEDFEALVGNDNISDYEPRADSIVISNAVQQICRDAPDSAITARVINVGIDYFQRRDESGSSFELLNTMVSRGIAPTPDSIRLLFTACCSGDEDIQLGLFFLDHLIEDLDDQSDVVLLQTVASEALRWAGRMTSTKNDDRAALVDTVFDKLVESGMLKNNVSVYDPVMVVFGQGGNIVQAQKIANRMLSETGNVSLSVANRLLQACAVSRLPASALKSLGWMRRHGAQPDLMSYVTVLTAIRRQHEVERRVRQDDSDASDDEDEDEADDVAVRDDDSHHTRKKRRSRLEADWNVVLDGLVTAMQNEGISPNAAAFESLVAIASLRGEVRRVLELYDTIKDASSKQQVNVSALLNQNTILHYLDACSAVASTDAVREVARRVHELRLLLAAWYRERGYRIYPRTILRILEAYEALGQWQDAVAVLKNVTDEFGVKPTAEMFKIVMQSCNDAGEYHAVEQIFATMQMPRRPGGKVYPTAACYVEAIYANEEQGDWPHATQLFMEMQKNCSVDELHPALMRRIALGRYAEGRKHPDFGM
jgi:pentatricopeptide repeat protein